MELLFFLTTTVFFCSLLVFIIFKRRGNKKVNLVFYIMVGMYFTMSCIIAFYPNDNNFGVSLSLLSFELIAFVTIVIIYRLWNQSDKMKYWYLIFSGLFIMETLGEMIDPQNPVIIDIAVIGNLYIILLVAHIIVGIIKRNKLAVIQFKIISIMYLSINTVTVIWCGLGGTESFFTLIIVYFIGALVGGILYYLIKKRIINFEEIEEKDIKIENDGLEKII